MSAARDAPSLVVWMVTDGKAGHLNQMRGLVHALGERASVEPHTIAALPRAGALAALATKRFAPGVGLPDPDLVLAAGHGTHLSALAARRARGGKLIALMRPTLPLRWFDLVIAPRHDFLHARRGGAEVAQEEEQGAEPSSHQGIQRAHASPPCDDSPASPHLALLASEVSSPRVVLTLGALCDVRPAREHDPARGVFLIGGPSKLHGWDEEDIAAQVRAILEREGGVRWSLTTSRRTPAPTLARLEAMASERLEIVPHERTPPGWVRERLARGGIAWVSEDSVSMVHEALTSGCAVGTLRTPRLKAGRVARGMDDLAAQGLLTTFEAWERGRTPTPPAAPIDEAARCAQIILERVCTPEARRSRR